MYLYALTNNSIPDTSTFILLLVIFNTSFESYCVYIGKLNLCFEQLKSYS